MNNVRSYRKSAYTEIIAAEEPGEFQERIRPFVPNLIITKALPGDFFVACKAAQTPEITLLKNNVLNIRVMRDPQVEYVTITIPLDGTAEIVTEGRANRLEIGQAHVNLPLRPFEFRSLEAHSVIALNMSRQMIRRTMCDLGLNDQAGYKKLGTTLDLKQEPGDTFFRLVTFFCSEFFRTPTYLNSPKLTGHMENALTTAFILATFGSDPDQNCQGNWLNPQSVDAALDFMHANLDRPLTLSEISATTGANARTLTRAFRSAYEAGPVTYHRMLRLKHAHNALVAAHPVDTTVTDIAMEYGFYQLSHFASAYKKLFSEAPSATLRK